MTKMTVTISNRKHTDARMTFKAESVETDLVFKRVRLHGVSAGTMNQLAELLGEENMRPYFLINEASIDMKVIGYVSTKVGK